MAINKNGATAPFSIIITIGIKNLLVFPFSQMKLSYSMN